MRFRTIVVALLLAGGIVPAQALAQVAAPEAELLHQVSETYRGLGSYLLEGSIAIMAKGANAPTTQELPFLIAAAPGGKSRDEVRSGQLGGMILSDGRQTTIYNAPLGQYMRKPGRADSATAGTSSRGLRAAVIARFADIAKSATAAKRLPDATLTLSGVPRDCAVIEVTYPPLNPQVQELPRTYWIEKSTHLVLRQRTVVRADSPQYGGKVEQSEEFLLVRALRDTPLPESTWVFHPPASIKEVDQFVAPTADTAPVSPFVGRPATDFTLKDLAGRPHTLKSLRGKVVLLDFWATWCGPCRHTLPQVAKIHARYKDRGVEVMSVNVGEPGAKAADYLKQNGYAFTALLDTDRRVSTDYQVNGIPTLVVIDRAGTISDYMVGVRDEAALSAALKKAGVK